MRTTKQYLLLGGVSVGLALATACSKDPSELNQQWQARITQLQKEVLEARSVVETRGLETKTLQDQMGKLQLKVAELDNKLKACEAKLPLDASIENETPVSPATNKSTGDKPAGAKGELVGPPRGLVEPKINPISPPKWLTNLPK